jgi:L-lactate dehydrogenase complex protein LldG
MTESKTRDKILKRIRQAVIDKSDLYGKETDYRELASPADACPELQLAESFISLGGHFVYCEKQKELTSCLQDLIDQLQPQSVISWYPPLLKLLRSIPVQNLESGQHAEMTITYCPVLIASPPGMIVPGTAPLLPARYSVLVAAVPDIVPTFVTAFERLKESFRTGVENRFEIVHFDEFFREKAGGKSSATNCWFFLTEEEL